MQLSTILVVDDDPDTCQLLSMVLNDGRVRVETALDGFQGLEKVKSLNPSLIVLDVMMPGMDGWETYIRMKAHSDVPILFLSAKSDLDSVTHGLDLGANDYVCKPFHVTDLRRRISEILDRDSRLQVDEEVIEVKVLKVHLQDPIVLSDNRFYQITKRVFDVVVSSLALLGIAPVMVICALLVKLETRGPVLYKQKRVGLKKGGTGKGSEWELGEFELLKLRTMYFDANPDIHREYSRAFIRRDKAKMESIQGNTSSTRKLLEDGRVTRIGRFLRRSSLDEFPQLVNVIMGHMSLVGPRPPIPYETEVYEPWHMKRLSVKPGVTGLWQATCRSSTEFDEMVRMDIWYIEHRSLLLDLKILLKTPAVILSTRGAA
jgi:lipopolysaccharide/colanic/teichoic acid biosynthesis glycosyltransferase